MAPRDYTQEEIINTRLAKGEIPHRVAARLLRDLREKKEKEEIKKNRSVGRRILDFLTP